MQIETLSTLSFVHHQRSFASGVTYDTPPGSSLRGNSGSGGDDPFPDHSTRQPQNLDIYQHRDLSDVVQDSAVEDRVPEASEGDLDHLLTKWEAMMDGADPEHALSALVQELDSSHGLPEWAEILERGDEEELMERAQRRSREQSLQQEFAARRVRVVDRLGRAYATGKRKCSIARCWIEEGPGQILVNGRTLYGYFPAIQRRSDVLLPFLTTGTLGSFDVHANIRGGGMTGQAQALRHGISRALQLFDPDHRPALKAAGLLTRDSRIVERKKPGRPKARKSFQWVKR